MKKPTLGPRRRTNPLVWCLAIICAVLTVVVIITGIVVFIGYMVARPKVPQMSVANARIDTLYYDMVSLLTVKISIVIKAENDNARARAYFYKTSYALSFHGVKVAYLNADPFEVPKNSSTELYYQVESSPIPLTPEEGERVEAGLKNSNVTFELKGNTRTRWRVWVIGSVRFWLHLDCRLKLPVDGTTIYPKCNTKSR
ncbi:PREDICTED: NDR1/HIN1-like protein 12 [Ipomoea nil]|uniref:NDR1/HIN1-like protein 12 n=1 Tax=Ipomoea nil TaxID=35883 RepID=UPI000901D69F|nr:PREDICTED: NDR1/HIN1-like protein 12 [Ipomoea nil]